MKLDNCKPSSLLQLTCCAWALKQGHWRLRRWRRLFNWPVSEEAIVRTLTRAGFRYIDITPKMFDCERGRTLLSRYNLKVNCVAIQHQAPTDCQLDEDDSRALSQLMQHLNQGIAHASNLTAKWVYVLPGQSKSPEAMARFGKRCLELAQHAQNLGVRFCIEHLPGSALTSASETIGFINQLGHPNIYLLLDLGHLQISQESVAETIALAANRLGYVQINDNNGKQDLHLPPTQGIQTEAKVRQMLQLLINGQYQGPISLELNARTGTPATAVANSQRLLSKLLNELT